jgi:hypothetical protein
MLVVLQEQLRELAAGKHVQAGRVTPSPAAATAAAAVRPCCCLALHLMLQLLVLLRAVACS